MKKKRVVNTASCEVQFTCECGGRAYVDLAGTQLIHTLPYCKEFEQLAPDEYVRRNRKRIARGEN